MPLNFDISETRSCANANTGWKKHTSPLQSSPIAKERMYRAHSLILFLLIAELVEFFLGRLLFSIFFPASPLELSPHLIIDLSPAVVLCSNRRLTPHFYIIFTPISRFFLLAILHFAPSLRLPISSAQGVFFSPRPLVRAVHFLCAPLCRSLTSGSAIH